MLSIGTCPTCDAGALGLRKCGVCRRVVVLCDECDVAWGSGKTSTPRTQGRETMPCPHCHADLWSSGSIWATNADTQATPWIIDLGEPPVESAPFEPGR